jgi:hypothetical protein
MLASVSCGASVDDGGSFETLAVDAFTLEAVLLEEVMAAPSERGRSIELSIRRSLLPKAYNHICN